MPVAASQLRHLLAGAVAVGAALAAVLMTCPPAAAVVNVGHSSWSWGNPLPQGNAINGLEFIGSRGYAAGDFGTLLRSDDAGASWTGAATGIVQDLSRISVIDTDSIVVAGGCTVRRSDNAGRSFDRLPWTGSDLNCPEPVVSLSFPADQVGYLLIANGDVFRTADGGGTWSRRTAVPETRVTGGSVQPTDFLFTTVETGVVTTAAGRIYRTTDAGGSWTLVRTQPQALNGLTFVGDNVGYAVGDASSVLKTTNGGASWTQKTAGALRITSIRCADANRCLATVDAGDRLLRTIDGGNSFASVTPSSDKIFAAAFSSATRAVAAGAFGTTVASNDGGATWLVVGGRIADQFTRLRAQSSLIAFAAGNAGVLARTTDGGASWTTLGVATSADVVDASFPTEQTGFALDSTGALLRTDNAGASWQILDTGTARAPLAVLALDSDRIFLIGPRGIRRSTDGGGEFDPVRGKAVSKAVLFDYDRGRCLFAHGSKKLIFSSNSGRTWEKVRLPERPIIDVDFSSCNTGFVLTREGRLYRTRNRGGRWKQRLGLGPDVLDISFSSSRNGYAAANRFGNATGAYVLRTLDGGKTWRPELVQHQEIEGEQPLVSSPGGRLGDETALLLAGKSSLFTTLEAEGGKASALRLATRKRRLRRRATIAVTGRLRPADGGERVVISMREAKRTDWRQKLATVTASGTFTTTWQVARTSFFVAQWAGEGDRDGDGSIPLKVTVRR